MVDIGSRRSRILGAGLAALLSLHCVGAAAFEAPAPTKKAKRGPVGPATAADAWLVGTWCNTDGGKTVYERDGTAKSWDATGLFMGGGYRWALAGDRYTEIIPSGDRYPSRYTRVGADAITVQQDNEKWELKRC